MRLLIATHNPGKLREYSDLLTDFETDVISLHDIGLSHLAVDETSDSFHANALLKATTYARASGCITIADDSGLEVDALGGAPGIYSARYGGEGLDDAGRRAYLLAQMADVPDEARTARFICVIALYHPLTGAHATCTGVCEGRILRAESDGSGGFGYDKLFVPNGFSQSFAQMSAEQKHRVSHRGQAMRGVSAALATLLGR